MVNLGVIGMSEGNGHPYSWSAIINGYHKQYMEECGFPIIPRYLEKQIWPQAKIQDAHVTHIWTQSSELSEKIARATFISNIVAKPSDMIGKVNAVLLARDDAENHIRFARPFIEVGLPVYIDKPIALSIKGLKELYGLEQFEGQIFTCSALRYAQELIPTQDDLKDLGVIKHIDAITPQGWAKYSVHIIEPIINIIGQNEKVIVSKKTDIGLKGKNLIIGLDSGKTVSFSALGENIAAPISLRIFGEKGWREYVFSNSFSAFKSALADFLYGIRNRSCQSPKEFNYQAVQLIELGM